MSEKCFKKYLPLWISERRLWQLFYRGRKGKQSYHSCYFLANGTERNDKKLIKIAIGKETVTLNKNNGSFCPTFWLLLSIAKAGQPRYITRRYIILKVFICLRHFFSFLKWLSFISMYLLFQFIHKEGVKCLSESNFNLCDLKFCHSTLFQVKKQKQNKYHLVLNLLCPMELDTLLNLALGR